MLAELETVRGMLHTYESVYTEKLAGNTAPGLFVEKALLDKLAQALDSCDNQDVNSLILALKHIKSIAGAMGTESMASILDAITQSLPEMAQELGKAVPHVVINDHNIRFVPDIALVIKNVLTHSFRNAMDHGLETSAERKAQGKPEWGTISVEVNLDGEQVVLMVSDDGRGLAVNKLKQKAIQNGSLNAQEELSAHELSELIFKSGLTTADKVSDISGRGVGMDAIRKFVENAGGKVDINFKQKPKQDSEYLPFVLNITLPASCTKQLA